MSINIALDVLQQFANPTAVEAAMQSQESPSITLPLVPSSVPLGFDAALSRAVLVKQRDKVTWDPPVFVFVRKHRRTQEGPHNGQDSQATRTIQSS